MLVATLDIPLVCLPSPAARRWVVSKSIDFSKYPKVTKWWADIKAYPVVAEMYASCVDGRQMIPA